MKYRNAIVRRQNILVFGGFMKSLTDEFYKELIDEQKDNVAEYLELSIDSFFDSGVIKDIPMIGTLTSMYKAGRTVNNYVFMKKIIAFLHEYNNSTIVDDKLNEFTMRVEEDEKYKQRVIESLITIIDRLDDEIKSRILSKIFVAFINGIYTWDEFTDLSRVIDGLFSSDIRLIMHLIKINCPIMLKDINIEGVNYYRVKGAADKLSTYGFVVYGPLTWGSTADDKIKEIELTSYGAKFYNLCLLNVLPK